MATLADLSSVYTPSNPTGFGLAGIELQATANNVNALGAQHRAIRNFSKFHLPELLSGQAARGAFASGATQRKAQRLAVGTQDSLAEIAAGLGPAQAQLATNALLAQTGIQL